MLAEAARELSDTLKKKLLKAGVHLVDVLLPAGRSESPLIKNTLVKDPTAHGGRGAGADLHAAAARARRRISRRRGRRSSDCSSTPSATTWGGWAATRSTSGSSSGSPKDHTVLTEEDFIAIIRYLIELREGRGYTDDIDHLGNRRVRSVGELIANQFSVGLSRMARLVKERMSINNDPERITLDDLVNARTVSAVIQAFFGSSQLSQFMDQTNPLAELTHKRRLLGARAGRPHARARRLRGARRALLAVRPHVPDRDAGRSEHRTHHAALVLRARQRPGLRRDAVPRREGRQGHRRDRAGCRRPRKRNTRWRRPTRRSPRMAASPRTWCCAASGTTTRCWRRAKIDFMDVAPEQLVSIAAALIPFLEHDDANRALMGSNMQRQSGAAALPAGAAGGHGPRGEGGARLRRRGDRPARRASSRGSPPMRSSSIPAERGPAVDGQSARPAEAARPLPPEEVLAHQPGHGHQPAAAGARWARR